MNVFPTLFKVDSKGKIREWRMEIDGARYRTVAGLADGKQVTSEWKATEAKNVGRSNATTAEEQAVLEVEALYTKRLDGEYHTEVTEVNEARFVKPMLAAKWEDQKDKIKYPVFIQPKLDGIRCIANKAGLWSRTGKAIVAVPHIAEALVKFFNEHPDAILDGELYNHEYKDDFNSIISMVRKTKPSQADLDLSREKVEYHVYDIASVDSNFEYRRISFNQAVTEIDSPCVVAVETAIVNNETEVDDLYGTFIGAGYEGGIIRANDKYVNKRSKGLLKRKDFEDKEFEIVRIEEGKGNWSGYAKRVFFRLEDGRECGAGLKGNQEYTREVLANADNYIGKKATIQYFTRTPDGVPRFPIAKALHMDKRW